MSCLFLYGGSGSGKTHLAFQNMIDESLKFPETRFFVLVPEQYTMLMQKSLLAMHPDHASENVEVMSFNRLSYRVFGELNISHPDVMDDTGKAMILRKVAAEKKDELSVFRNQFKKPGFTGNMKSMISELYQYGITPDMLREALKGDIRQSLKKKLSDMLVIYEGFSDYIKDRYIPAEELLDVLCRAVPESTLIRDSVIFLDGFTGFTPVQYRLIELFLIHARKVEFTVTIGEEESLYRRERKDELFFMSTEMTARITDLASKNGITCSDIRLPLKGESQRFYKSRELAFFEKHFLRHDREVFPGTPADIRIVKALNPKQETEYVSGQILKLVRKSGYRYREIAVVTGDLSNYGDELKHEFAVQGIPFYMDENMSILSNPLPELLRSALQVMTEAYSRDSIVRFLKCGLVTEETEEVCVLENYMLECGVRGFPKMSAAWTFVPPDMKDTDMEKLNAFKDGILSLLLPLHDALNGGHAALETVTAALEELLRKTEAEKKLQSLREAFRNAGDVSREREYGNVFTVTEQLFKRMTELLGKEDVTREEYAGILDAGLNEIRVGMIPACADRVAVGDLKRTRLSEIRALFLLGANEGIIPRTGASGGILTDREKELLQEIGMELSPTAREDLYTQRYYLYRMLTEPSEKLCISCSGMDAEGKALRVSGIVNRVKKLFENFPEDNAAAEDDEEIYSAVQAERALIRALADGRDRNAGTERLKGLLRLRLKSSSVLQEKSAQLLQAASADYCDTGIGSGTAALLYGSELSGSVTRLEDFAQCPYAHFLKYGLGLGERKVYEIAPSDIGTLSHATIENAFRRAEKMKKPLAAMEDAERDRIVEESAAEALENDESGLYRDSARNRYLTARLTEIAKRSIFVFTEQLKRGRFQPVMYEQTFSDRDGLQAMDISLSRGRRLKLRGKIDRVDLAEENDKVYVKIIDYKTGKNKWEPGRVLSGTELQLVLYLDAVEEMMAQRFPEKEIIPAAVLYEHIDNPFIDRADAETPAEMKKATLKAMKPSGLLNRADEVIALFDPDRETAGEVLPVTLKKDGTPDARSAAADQNDIDMLRKYVLKKAAEEGTAILDGKISVSPVSEEKDRNACTFCPYGAVCRFDRKTEGYAFRKEPKRKPAEVWEIVNREITGGTKG